MGIYSPIWNYMGEESNKNIHTTNVTKNSVIKQNCDIDTGPVGLLHLIYRERNWYPKAQKIDATQEQLPNIEW